ncbi:hypothetical protein MLD38_012269 [Melastoma candidum]|uniref:Uncharacterized protein n=1 Tax=Melastoma candidum TaxID=119954 RepID=A0ACB9RE80_9MYRT|nr:hypothetical protein MLD38_012269 [Melastoma candidum]
MCYALSDVKCVIAVSLETSSDGGDLAGGNEPGLVDAANQLSELPFYHYLFWNHINKPSFIHSNPNLSLHECSTKMIAASMSILSQGTFHG